MNKPTRELADRTEEFALRIIRLVRALPKDNVADVLGRQVLRSGTSVGANYREAVRSRRRAEFVAKIGDSLKEAEETAYWLNLLLRSELVTESKLSGLRAECDELTAIFVSSIKTARRAPGESPD